MPRRVAVSVCLLLLLWLGPTACRRLPLEGAPQPTIAAVAPTAGRTSQPTEPPRAPTPSMTARAETATAAPSPTASATPTPTMQRPLRLAVPPVWRLEAERAAALVGRQDGFPGWEIVVADNAGEHLDSGVVDAALLADDGGIVVGQRPVVLAVPFSHEWDGVTPAEAVEIQAAGHAFVQVVPWHALSPGQRALRIDGLHPTESGYPLQQSWSIHAAAPWQEQATQFAAMLRHLSGPGDVHLAAVGDIMLDRQLGDAIAGGDMAFPFAFVAAQLQATDYTVGNLESALGDSGEPAAKSYTFRAPPAAAVSLAAAGFDLVSLANNHALDFGPEALLQGIGLLEAAGVASVGAGADAEQAHRARIVEINGLTFAFLGYVNVPVEGRAPYFDTSSWRAGPQQPGIAWAAPEVVAADVSKAAQEAEHVVVILHSGYEYVPAPSPEQAAAARSAIDAGATLVIGHHAHILQGVEFRGKGAIVYGLGNFAFNITGPPQTAILNAWFDEGGLRQLRFDAALIQGSGQPVPANVEDAAGIRGQIYSLSRVFN